MRTLLCLFLSFSILFSSVSPSLAKGGVVRNFKRGAKGVRVKPKTNVLKSSPLQTRVARGIQQQQYSSALSRIHSSIQKGSFDGLSAQILRLSDVERAPLLRKEFVSLAVDGQITAADLTNAAAFYRTDLPSACEKFSSFAGQNLQAALSSKSDALKDCHNAFSDAAGLALMGGKEDAALLIKFYEQTAGTPFRPAAAAVTARGLLQLGAYDEFSAWAKQNAEDGYFWGELSAYVQSKGLPVELNAAAVPAEEVSAELQGWLKKGFAPNALHADFSREATEKWMNLRVKPLSAKPSSNAPAAAPSAANVALPEVSLLNVEIPSVDLSLAPVELAGAEHAAASSAASAVSAPAAPVQAAPESGTRFLSRNTPSSSNSGVLYSGLPVFEMANAAKKAYRGIVNLFRGKKPARKAVSEEPGLHENSVRPVFESRRVSPMSWEADGYVPVPAEEVSAEVAEDGFKFTVANADGTEHILNNVDVSVDASIKKARGYNRIVLAQDHIFELRNLELPPGEIDHFYVEMSNANGELVRLGHGASALKMPRPLRIKLEKVPNRRYKVRSLSLFYEGSVGPGMVADVDASLVPAEKGYLLADKEGNVWFVGGGKRTLLQDYYIRLPKEDGKYWAKIMQQDGKPFTLQLHSTLDKTGVLSSWIPALQIGWGKIGGRVLNEYATLDEFQASSIMFGINNVLPSLVGFVHPLLKRYGEARVSRWGVGFLLSGGVIAALSGLPSVMDGALAAWQTGGFLGGVTLMALGTAITRYVQNMLISANRGKVMMRGAAAKKARSGNGALADAQKYDGKYLWKRTKEVFSLRKLPGTRNGPLFQKATAMKNFGAMLFFACPWLINQACELATGVNPGFNIMLGFLPYTLFATGTFLKVKKTAYKDAFPKDVTVMKNKFQDMLAQVTDELAALPPSALQAGADETLAAAKLLHKEIKGLATAEIREKGVKDSFESKVLQHEAEAVQALRTQLVSKHGLTPEQAEQESRALQEAFDSLEHRGVKLSSVLKTKLLKPSLAAMALATVHELSVSSGFSFAMKGLEGTPDYEFAMTGLSLYGSMYLGRFLGNWMSRYISSASMYGFSSLTSIAGTAMMAAANATGDMNGLITGSLVASFGVGNFFAAMYEHMVNLAPQFQREISLLITYTMPVAALLSMPMRWLVEATGMPSIDLWLSEAAVGGSLLLTTAMLKNSTLLKVAKNEGSRLWKKVKGVFKRGGNNKPGDLNGAAPAH